MDASITDWLQTIFAGASLIITVAGLFYIAITLQEQAKVNEAQYKLLDIESRRAAREIRPYPFLNIIGENEDVYDKNGYETRDLKFITRTYSLSTSNSIATDLCFEYFDLPPHGCYSSHFKPGKQIAGNIGLDKEIKLKIQFPKIDNYGIDYVIKLRLHYKDQDERAYWKDFTISKDAIFSGVLFEESNHPNINVCNLFDKIEYAPHPNGITRHNYLWAIKDIDYERFDYHTLSRYIVNKKDTLRMYSLGINYTVVHQQMHLNDVIALSPQLFKWEVMPFM